MSRPGSLEQGWLQALACGGLATALCALASGLLLLPQRLAQRPLAQGVIAVQLAPDGGLRLWHQPISPGQLRSILAVAAQRRPPPRLRLVPDPRLPWGEVRRALALFHREPLSLELQLPPPAARP